MKRTLLLLISGCFISCGGVQNTAGKSEAQLKFEEAQTLLDDQHPIEARELFNQVKNDYPFSPYAALAALRVGDAFLAQEMFSEAIDAYQSFIRNYPDHAEVPNAIFKQAKGYFAERPSDMAILPPSFERDKGATRNALTVLRQFARRYPNHKSMPDVERMIATCRATYADYELYVATFYLEQDKPWAAKTRLEKVVKEFEDTPAQWREGALKLAKVYQSLASVDVEGIEPLANGRKMAANIARRLKQRFPRSKEALDPLLDNL